MLDYSYFKEHKLTGIDLSKQQALDADPKAVQKNNLTGYLDRAEGATMFFIIEEAKKNYFRFFTVNCESIASLYFFNIISV